MNDTPGQLPLAGLDDLPQPQPPRHSLFFALLPPPQVAERIAALALQLKARHRLAGRPLQTQKFHVTLQHLGNFPALPPGLVADAQQAAAALGGRAFDIRFDRAASFSGRPRNRPFVLRAPPAAAEVLAFQQRLSAALVARGLPVDPRFTPHLTLLYDDRLVAEEPVEPVTWRVAEFVLMQSLLGQSRHLPLGRWPLDEGEGG